MPFLDWLPTAKIPPRILRDWGGVWTRAVALVLDAMTESARQAVRLRFPTGAPPDALAAIAEERGEARATAVIYEDDTRLGERLRTSWSRRRRAGTKVGLVTIFEVFGFPAFQVFDRREWFPSKAWHAWVFLAKGNHPWGHGPRCGDGTRCGDGSVCGVSMRSEQVRNLRRVTASWVPPHARVFLHLQLGDGPLCGDGHTCGGAGSVCGGGNNSAKLRLGKATLS